MCNLSGDLYFRHVFPPLSNNTSCKSLLKTKMLPRSVECWRHRGEYNGPNKRLTSPPLWVGSDQVRTTFLVGMILRLLKVRYLWANFKLKKILIIWCSPYRWWWPYSQVLCLAHVGCGQLCSWVTSNLTWAAGARLELSISNIHQVCVVVLVIREPVKNVLADFAR